MQIAAALAAVLVVAGCATDKELVPIGGSRADGTVKLSYDYTVFEKPNVDMTKAAATAADRCKVWGYTGAQPFGGSVSKCALSNGNSCIRFTETVTYQCTGSPPA